MQDECCLFIIILHLLFQTLAELLGLRYSAQAVVICDILSFLLSTIAIIVARAEVVHILGQCCATIYMHQKYIGLTHRVLHLGIVMVTTIHR